MFHKGQLLKVCSLGNNFIGELLTNEHVISQ